MKTENLPLSFKESLGKNLRRLLICIMIIVTILTSLGIFILKDFGLGYKYYEINNSQTVYIGMTKEENFLEKTINKYLEQLNNDGYYIVSSSLNKTFIENISIIPKSTTNEDKIEKRITNNLDVSVLCTKLNIKDDETTYYFKTQSECDNFINSLNEYIKQEFTVDGDTQDYRIITKQEVLDSKLNNIKEQKEKNDAEVKRQEEIRKQKQKVTSRGGISRINKNYSGGAPMASYIYISSYYGKRGSGNHTGVDFAAHAGTSIYAWKSGVVTFVGWSGGYGKFIIIKHDDGSVSRYAHCSGYACSKGQRVEKGQTIGYVGTTGNSTGNHLHFEIQINGCFVNPLNYL